MTTLTTSFNQDPNHQRDKRFLIGLAGLWLAGLVTVIIAYQLTKTTLNREKLKIFHQDSEKIQQLVEERMLNHVSILRGLNALWAQSPRGINQDQFNLYLDSLNILNDFPGISSVAFVKAQGEKMITTYLIPLAGRESALGLDQAAQPGRKEFFDQVRDSGLILSSQPFILTTTNRPGFFLAGPLYTGGKVPVSLIERREKLIGFAGLTFRESELFTAIFGRQNLLPDIDFHIYHEYWESPPGDEHLLFDSDPGFTPADTKLLQTKKYITVGQTPWTIFITAKPSFSLTWAEENLPRRLLAAGLTLSGLYGLLILSFYFRHLKTWH